MRRARSLELSQQAVSRRIGLAFEEEGTSASRPMPCCCMN
jgi:hypothetical protein